MWKMKTILFPTNHWLTCAYAMTEITSFKETLPNKSSHVQLQEVPLLRILGIKRQLHAVKLIDSNECRERSI
uniref:Uncharacterized protein n=1 Tax=Manihot esculenta TaxID=3983 RepID=A0A2C9U1K8_MANES